MSVTIVNGHQIREIAAMLGVTPTLGNIRGALTPKMAAACGGHLKARRIHDKYLALAAADTARQQPQHADDWSRVAAALRDHADGTDPEAIARAFRSHLDGIDAEAAARILRDGLR